MKRTVIAALLLSAAVGLPAAAFAQSSDRPVSGGTAPGSAMGDQPPPATAGSPAGTRLGDGTKGQSSSSAAGDSTFRSLDTNKDGFVSRDEVKGNATLSRQFNELDKDGDGRLSPAELSGAGTSTPRDASSRGGTAAPERPSSPPAGSDAAATKPPKE